jgi:putative transposase
MPATEGDDWDIVSLHEHKNHLRRLSLVSVSQPLYFITTCAADRNNTLARDDAVRIFREEWSTALDRHGWAVGSYVIMPDHVHLFCRSTGNGKSLSGFLQAWKQWTSKRLKAELGFPPPVWQEGFFDHILRSEESYAQKWKYVKENPVRAQLVNNADQWQFSGHIHFE